MRWPGSAYVVVPPISTISAVAFDSYWLALIPVVVGLLCGFLHRVWGLIDWDIREHGGTSAWVGEWIAVAERLREFRNKSRVERAERKDANRLKRAQRKTARREARRHRRARLRQSLAGLLTPSFRSWFTRTK